MARAVASGTIAFGLVSIPVRFYTATSSKAISFHLLHAPCGARIQYRNWCPTCERLVERTDLVRGYPIARNEYVRFTEAEIEGLEQDGARVISIATFVPLSTVDPIYYENTYYLGPDERGEKPYRLLTEAMRQTEVEAELTLAKRLIAGLAAEAFDPVAYRDTYREQVLALVERKAAGRDVTVAPEAVAPPATLDLMDALKRSLERKPPITAAQPPRPAKAPVDLAQARARRTKRARAS